MAFSANDTTVSAVEVERQQYRAAQQRKATITSIVSSLAFIGIIWGIIRMSPGAQQVQEAFFSPEYFLKSLPHVLQGLLTNIQVLIVAAVGVAILGTLLALIRTSRSAVLFPLRVIAAIYTTIFRGIPMLVVLYLVGFGVPGLGLFGRVSPVVFGTTAVILSYSAYVAEVLRAGFQDVHPSQRASARSLGLTTAQTVRLVIIPQALRKIAPALMNDFIAMQKDVGLISVLGIVDAVRAAQIDVAQWYNFTPYVVASVLFIALSVPFILINDWYANKLRTRELVGGTV